MLVITVVNFKIKHVFNRPIVALWTLVFLNSSVDRGVLRLLCLYFGGPGLKPWSSACLEICTVAENSKSSHRTSAAYV